MNMKPIRVWQLEHGAVMISRWGHWIMEENNTALANICTRTKWTELHGTMDGNTLIVGACEKALHIAQSAQNLATYILLPDYHDWDFWAVECGRYSIKLALIKRQNQ